MNAIGGTVGKRLAGERPGRLSSLLIAGAAGGMAAVLTYRLLRTDAGSDAA